MKKMKLITRSISIACFLITAFTACTNDDQEPILLQEPGLYFNMASNGEPKSMVRALTDDEAKISDLQVLYFAKTGSAGTDADYTYLTKEQVYSGTAVSLGSGMSYRLKATGISSPGTSKDRKVIFLANTARTNFSALTLVAGPSGTKLDDFRKMVISTEDPGVTVWKKNSTYLIPMYVCSEPVNIPTAPYSKIFYINGTDDPDANTKPRTYNLLRMMAKFTINNETINPSGDLYNYEIKSVALVNGYTTGLVCHTVNTEIGSGVTERVTTPSIPSPVPNKVTSVTGINTLTSLVEGLGTWSSTIGSVQAITFYAFETSTPITGNEGLNNKNNCYIYLKGTRKNASTSVDNIEYMVPIYALGGTTTTATPPLINPKKAGPILRNHNYTYTIQGVFEYSLRVNLSVRNWTNIPIATDPIPLN